MASAHHNSAPGRPLGCRSIGPSRQTPAILDRHYHLRVLVTGRKGFDVPATVEALGDALASFRALLGREGGAEDHDAA